MTRSADLDVIETKLIHRGYFDVRRWRFRHRRFDGTWSPELDREICEKGPAVVVLPYDPVLDRVVLIEQLRIAGHAGGSSPWLIETVAGAVEKGESPEESARRELKEEAGLEAQALAFMGSGLPTPGTASEVFHGFVARVDAVGVGGVHGNIGEAEDIRAFVLEFDKALDWWREGRIGMLPAVTLLLGLAVERQRLRAEWT